MSLTIATILTPVPTELAPLDRRGFLRELRLAVLLSLCWPTALLIGLGQFGNAQRGDRITQGLGRSGRERGHRHWWQSGPVGLITGLFAHTTNPTERKTMKHCTLTTALVLLLATPVFANDKPDLVGCMPGWGCATP